MEYVAGEGVELTVHEESVVVEKIKEVELRCRRAQFIYDRNYNRIGLQPCSHALALATSCSKNSKKLPEVARILQKVAQKVAR